MRSWNSSNYIYVGWIWLDPMHLCLTDLALRDCWKWFTNIYHGQKYHNYDAIIINLQRVPKKMGFSGKIAITTLKHIQNANVGGVLENSGYLLHYGHWDFQNWRRNDWENEAWSCQPPSKNRQNSLLTLCTPLMILCIFMTCNESKICSTNWQKVK